MAGERKADRNPRQNNVTDEDWLVQRAKQCLKSDPYAAKAWLLTARSLFPKNFNIQYEAYCMEKNAKNIREVAKILEEMFVSFPNEDQLWQEVRSYSEALQSEVVDDKSIFLRSVFAAFPASLQYRMLVSVADITQDIIQQCRLMLLILHRYPDQVPDHGVKLIDSLLSTEKHYQPPSPVNCYRKYLVCHVLPEVLKTCPQMPPKQLYRWLQKAIEFYVCYITQPQTVEPLTPQSAGTDLASPTSRSYGGGSIKKVIIPGLTEKESHIDHPWKQLFGLLQMIGTHLEWDMAGFFGNNSYGAQWQRLQTLWEGTSHQSESSGPVKQVFYCATVLCLHCLYKYACHVDPHQFMGAVVGGTSSTPVVLLEAVNTDCSSSSSPEHKAKKVKTDSSSSSSPSLTASSSLSNASELTDIFLTALQCWELLHSSETLGKEFSKLLQHWKSETWSWLREFETDVLLYQGYFKEAIGKLTHNTGTTKEKPEVRKELQIACCQYCMGNYSLACERVLQVISVLPASTEPAIQLSQTTPSGRHLHFLLCKESEILPYCIHLLLTCFKEKAFNASVPDDMSLGHMIILMQYDWPKSEALLCDILQKIRHHGSFTYSLFCNYVINIDILEEFAFLKTQDGGRVNLDILPTSTKQITQTRTVTRGVNKGVKEDFKAALEKQVSRNEENVETVIRNFLLEERELLQKHFVS